MANFAVGNATEVMMAMHGRPTQALTDFAMGTINNLARALPKGHEMIERAQARIHDFTRGEAARRVDALRGQISGAFGTDRIKRLVTLGELQQAGDVMRPYIMATPEVARRYHAGELSGYEGDYVDQYGPDRVGFFNPTYCQSIDSVLIEETNSEDEREYAIYDFQRFGDPSITERLSARERLDISATRRALLAELAEGMLDPTSVWNDMID